MSYNERYFFTFYADKDIRTAVPSDEYEVKILGLDTTEPPEEIQAQENPVTIVYQNSSDNKMEPFRGSECTLNLMATENFQLEDLYTENERFWLVQVYRNASLIWQGFIIPDGCQESFSFTPYTISVNAVDGMGLLKNLSYVQNDGNFWLGKQSFLDVIYNCFNRLGLPVINIKTCVNIYPSSYTPSDTLDPLDETYVDAQRFLLNDEINPMNCQEVLISILREWTSCIIMSEGVYYIYRPNEAALSDTLVFRSYTDNVYTGLETKDISEVLGGFSEGVVFAPYYHVNTDQLKMIERPYKNVSMSYKYGLKQNVDEELNNPTFAGAMNEGPGPPIGPSDFVTIPGWTKTGVVYAGLYGGILVNLGIIFYGSGTIYPVDTDYYTNDNVFSIDQSEFIKIIIKYKNPVNFTQADMNFIIMFTDGLLDWYLQTDGSWGLVAAGIGVNVYSVRSESLDVASQIEIVSQNAPTNGTISLKILPPSGSTGPIRDIVYTSISVKVYLDFGNVVGEIHTATQTGDFSYVPDTIDVLNGDSVASSYVGAIFKNDLTTLTTLWNRRGLAESVLALEYAESKPFLRIAVEELQRMYAQPYVKFEGSIGNYFNPLSLFSINLVTGRFMPVSLSYDLQANVCKAVLTRISNTEIAMDYTLEPDYGETTKITIK